MTEFHHPHVKATVERRPAGGSDSGSLDFPMNVEVDGQSWPVISLGWEIDNSRGGAILTIKVRGSLEVVE